MRKIAIEEHFGSVRNYNQSGNPINQLIDTRMLKYPLEIYKPFTPELEAKINDITEVRLKEMDDAGIDMQVLCLGGRGPEIFNSEIGTDIASQINNLMFKITREFPKRFAAFATIAPQNPPRATVELKRAVEELGLVGLKINSNLEGHYIDDQEYWPILEMAEKLEVPIYLHPYIPYGELLKPLSKYPALKGSLWGYTVDCGIQVMRLICSGVFDKYPGLKFILGHLGEALPFWLWRIDNRWEKEEHNFDANNVQLMKKPSQYIRDNFFVTTSGVFDNPPLMCTYQALGPDKILFAVDYPYESSKEAVQFLDAAPISNIDKEKIYHLNAENILSI